jgi:hypothetical protein
MYSELKKVQDLAFHSVEEGEAPGDILRVTLGDEFGWSDGYVLGLQEELLGPADDVTLGAELGLAEGAVLGAVVGEALCNEMGR